VSGDRISYQLSAF